MASTSAVVIPKVVKFGFMDFKVGKKSVYCRLQVLQSENVYCGKDRDYIKFHTTFEPSTRCRKNYSANCAYCSLSLSCVCLYL